jgi:hypothetical protein
MPSIEPGILTSVNTMLISSLDSRIRIASSALCEDCFEASILNYLSRHHKEQRFVLYDQNDLGRRILPLLLHAAGSIDSGWVA